MSTASEKGILIGKEPRNSALSIIPNAGQVDSTVRYYATSSTVGIFFTPHEARLHLVSPRSNLTLSLQFLYASENVQLSGQQELAGKVHYLKGCDSSKWITNLKTFSEIAYRELWPGIDLMFSSSHGRLKYTFIVQPGAGVTDIRLAYRGAERLSLDEAGNLVIHTSVGNLMDERPVCIQNTNNGQTFVKSRFYLSTDAFGDFFGVELEDNYDPMYPLIIDPGLLYSTYLGGTIEGSQAAGIAVNSQGNAFVTGSTLSPNFPTTIGSFQPTDPSPESFDAYVSKLSPDGSHLIYSTYLGGSSGTTSANAIALDTMGNAFITGFTDSPNFPVFPNPGAFQTSLAGDFDAFVTKFNADGTGLLYSTYLGGSGAGSQGAGIRIDTFGTAYVTGFTQSTNFPTTTGAFQETYPSPLFPGTLQAFISKLNPAGTGTTDLIYSTYLGGDDGGNSLGFGIDADSLGNALVTGQTDSQDFPTSAGAFQPADPSVVTNFTDSFVVKLNPAGTGTSDLIYSTYLGGTDGNTVGAGINVDSAGTMYVTGSTGADDFPTTSNSFQPADPSGVGVNDAFFTKLNPNNSGAADLVYSTHLGGVSVEATGTVGKGIAIDAIGNVYLTGFTFSPLFPTTPDAIQPADPSGPAIEDAFYTKLRPVSMGLADLVFSTYLGANTGSTTGNGIALDPLLDVYITGDTFASNFPTTPGAFQMSDPSPDFINAFVLKIGQVCPPDITVDAEAGQTGAFVFFASPAGTICSPPLGLLFPFGNDHRDLQCSRFHFLFIFGYGHYDYTYSHSDTAARKSPATSHPRKKDIRLGGRNEQCKTVY
ncbi:SBBP repeat-containing protein [Brevibacillus sp. NRS-1366]|uniref:DUF7948 domain-containing protein n=1 Tax=Brevibacillus sp. NRS-1366 TaxID=3233899 RepID=UPI003D24CABF